MTKLRMLQLAVIALAAGPVAGHAQTTAHTFKGKTFNLPTPAGFCTPDATNTNEAFFIRTITTLFANSGNKVVKIGAECNQLKQRRANPSTPIFDYIAYYYPDNTEAEDLPGDSQIHRKALCDDLRKQGDSTLDGVKDIVAKSAQELKSKVAVSGTKLLGVLAEDTHGCYVGILVNVVAASGPLMVNTNMMSTVIHGRTMFVSLYSKFQNPAESEKSLLQEQAVAAELDLRNPD